MGKKIRNRLLRSYFDLFKHPPSEARFMKERLPEIDKTYEKYEQMSIL